MPTLYEINRELFDIMDDLSADGLTPEQETQLRQRFDSAMASRDEKLASWAGYIKSVESDTDAVDAEIKRLKEKRESYAKRVENSKKYLGYMLNGEKWSNGVHNLGWRKSVAAIWADTTIPIPDEFARTKTLVEPDKDGIKKALQAGQRVPGWAIEERRNLQVK